MTVPDVRVRLSAEGTEEIIRAFQNVSTAAQKSGKTSAQGMAALTTELEKLKTLLPAIGIGAAAVAIGSLVKNALESTDAIGKLSQKVGMSSETLSVLAYGATKAGVEFQGFTKGLGLFNKTMANLDHGNAAAAASVRRLLGDSAALNGLDTEQRFMKVVEALAKMPAGYEKTRAAQEMFGKSGMELIPLLDQLGAGGFAKLMQRAQELGLVMSTEMTTAAIRASESLRDLKAEAQGAALQFVSGLTPALAQAAEGLVKATTGDGVNGFRLLGVMAGTLAQVVTKAFIVIGETIGFEMGEWSLWFDNFGQHAKDGLKDVALAAKMALGAVTGNPMAFVTADDLTQNADRQKRRAGADDAAKHRRIVFNAELANAAAAIDAPPGEPGKAAPTAEGGAAPNDTLVKGQVAALKAQFADELALYKAQDELLAAQQQRAYDDGKLSIAEYFADRAKAIMAGSAKEIGALEAERAAIAKAPIVTAGKSSDQIGAEQLTQKTELASIDSKIAIARLDEQKKLEDNTDKQGKAEGALEQHRLDAEKLIQAAQGDTYSAAIDAIKKQALALASAHVPQSLIDELTRLQTAAAQVKDLDRQGSLAMGGLSDVHAGLQTGVAAGDLFPFQALQQYDAAVQAALPHLRDLAAQELAAATALGDPAAIQKAHQFGDSIEQLGVTSSETAGQLAQIKQGIESGLQGAFTNFFTTGISQAHSFGDAMRTLALDVINSLQQIVAKILATQATKALLGLFPGLGGSDAGGQGSGAPTAAGAGTQVATAAATGVAQAAPLMVAATEMTAAGMAITAAGGSMVAGASAAMAAAMALEASALTMMAAAAAQAAASGAATAAAVVGAIATTAAVVAPLVLVAEGGLISGPGTGTSDSIPARLSAGEYVTPARVVAAPGNLEMLRQMHIGMQPFVFRSPGSYARESWARGYAEGGLVGAPSGAALSALGGASGSGGGNGSHHVIELSEGLVARHIESGPGSRAVIRTLGDNRNAVKVALGVK